MSVDFSRHLSAVGEQLQASEIRELLKLLDRPRMISFAGGLPNPAAFPVAGLEEVVQQVMREFGPSALQYCPTEGHLRLRNAIAQGMGEHLGAPQDVDNMVITAGSQQALYLLCTVLLNPGDVVLTASPTYLGALLTFNAHSADVQAIASDSDGMIPEALEERLTELDSQGKRVKAIYLVPTFDNPTGVTMPMSRRQRMYEIACKHDLVLIEDDPYCLLRYDGELVAPIRSLDVEGRVAYLGSFSKILAPGFRVGWLAAPPALSRRVVLAKQAQDLCTNTFGQYCVFGAMKHDLLFPHLETIKQLYQRKRDRMLAALKQYFPKEIRYQTPQGGLFLWVELPEHMDSMELLPMAINHDVAFVTGKPFYPAGDCYNTLRLNFSFAEDEHIDEGIRRLAGVIEPALDRGPEPKADDKVGIF